jgi:hypothetical protein
VLILPSRQQWRRSSRSRREEAWWAQARYVHVMPQSLRPEQFTMSIADGAPTITLHGVTVSTTDGWSILNRATLLVVDGPGEEGFLLPRKTSPDRDLAPEGWDDAVASARAVQVFVSGARVAATVID